MRKTRTVFIVAYCALAVIIIACSPYERRVVPFQEPQASPNAIYIDGAVIAARGYVKSGEAKDAFGFDIRGAGILPVQVVFDNKSEYSLMIIAEQTFVVDEDSYVWPILEQSMAYDRLAKHTELGRVVPEGAKRSLLFGAAGAMIGAAIGIVTGENVAAAAGKGAAVGAVAGAVSGGAQAVIDPSEVQTKIREDLRTRTLQYRAVRPGEMAHGFIFYPGEARSAKVLRLQVKQVETGKIFTYNMKLQ